MADESPKLEIRDLSSGGPKAHGHEIEFTFALSDRKNVTFTCGAGLLPKLIETLRQFGELAARFRSAQPGTLVEVVAPIQITKAARSGQTTDGTLIALDLVTAHWFPVQLTMPRGQARKTIELLEAELGKRPETKGRH